MWHAAWMLHAIHLGLGRCALASGVFAVLASTVGCSSDSAPRAGGGNLGEGGQNGGSGGATIVGSGGSSSGLLVTGSGGAVEPDASVDADADAPKRDKRCDDAGNCSCMNIMSYGKLAHYGSGQDNTNAFIDWLNSESSAHVDVITTHQTLKREGFLDNYDVIILQALDDSEGGPFWQFTDDEKNALEGWVRDGGGLITMTGYGNSSGEVDPTNSLLAFSNISYLKTPDQIDNNCPSDQNNLCYCWSGTVPISDWRTDTADCAAISAHIREIGVFVGRPIQAPSDASVCATDGTYDVAVAKDVDMGHVFAFADEWITYTSQWHPAPDAGVGSDIGTANAYNPCWLKDAGPLRTADVEFQIPQFWYNLINWVSTAQCPFEFKPDAEPEVIPDVH